MTLISAKTQSFNFLDASQNIDELAFHHLIIPCAIVTANGLLTRVNLAFANLCRMTSTAFDHEVRLSDFIFPGDRLRFHDWFTSLKSAAGKLSWFETRLLNDDDIGGEAAISLNELPAGNRWLACVFEKSKWDIKIRPTQTEELANLMMLVSHNLKSPIVSILGFTKLMSENLAEIPLDEFRHFLDRIEKNAARLEKMVRDIIEFSRLANKSHTFEELAIADIVSNVLAEYHYQLQSRSIKVRVAENFPRVIGVMENLQVVFSNLIDNAIKYLGDVPQPQIEIAWDEKPRFYVFWVKDNGIGVPEAFHEKVFEPFERAAAPTNIEGTGLGLAIVKRIVEQHGGVVRMSSILGRGATVYFTVPRQPLV